MFDIEYRGGNTVVFSTRKTQVVFDPKASVVGAKDVVVSDGVYVATEARLMTSVKTKDLVFDGPGEYEVKDVSLIGIAAQLHTDAEEEGRRATIYRMVIGDVRVAVVGNIASKLDDDQLEAIGVVDMAIVPVGGGGLTLDAMDAATIIRQIEPRAVVPVHYADSDLSYEVAQDDFDQFVKELSVGVIEAGPKFKVKNDSSIPEQMTIIKVSRT